MKNFSDFGIETQGKTGEIKTTCPKCSADRKKKNYPCLNVNTLKGTWHCWHCDWSGGLGSGIWQVPVLVKKYHKPTPSNYGISDKWVSWLIGRGITLPIITGNRLSSGMIWMPQIEAEVDALMFPYFKGQETVNIKYRDIDKNFRMYAGAQRVLYGLNDITPGNPLIMVEGEIDKLSCEVAGFKNCVSVPDGAPAPATKNYESKFDFLNDCKAELEAVPQFIIAVDSDAPGRRLQDELIRRLGPEKCLLVSWPEGAKDANEVLCKWGAETLSLCLSSAKPLPISGIFHVADFTDQIFGLFQDGSMRGRETGWRNVSDLYTVREGEWTVVTGIPGHGKSEWVDALMVNLALEHDWRFAICSPENQPLQSHFAKISEKLIGKPFHRGSSERMGIEELTAAKDWIGEKFSFILPEEPNLKCILDLAKIEIYRRGIKGLVIDPWNELDHSRPGNLSETEYISQSLSELRRFARKHRIHIWVVAHPTKLLKDKAGKYPIPTPYDISGSAHWRNKADNALTIWRDMGRETRDVQIHVQKIRFKQVGRVGMAMLEYDRLTGRYSEKESSR